MLIEGDPFVLIEGMAIAGLAVGAISGVATLLPMMLQVGFGLTPFESGSITFIGAIATLFAVGVLAFLFAGMSVMVRWLGERYPVGQTVFFRSAFAIIPVVVIYAWRRELRRASAVPSSRTARSCAARII